MSVAHPTKFGWIGLGAMGCPMATQLLKKLPVASELHIFDINPTVVQHFARENDSYGMVQIAANAKQVAEKSVSCEEIYRNRIDS